MSLSSKLVGIFTHWMDGRSHPCFGLEAGCIGCLEKVSKRWRGYLFGHSYNSHCACLIEFPPESVRRSTLLSNPAQDLRGIVFQLTRVGPHPNSVVRVEVLREQRQEPSPGPEPDVVGHLCRLWGIMQPVAEVLTDQGDGQQLGGASGQEGGPP